MWSLHQALRRSTLALTAAALACGSEATEPPPAPPPLSVQPSFVTVGIGGTTKLFAAYPQASGANSTLQSEVVWRTADGSIASISASGMVRGLKAGRTRVSASWHGSLGTAFVTVLSAPGGSDGKRPVCGRSRTADDLVKIPKTAPSPCR
jgi:hypothetical protein